jgi:hypothetical protein
MTLSIWTYQMNALKLLLNYSSSAYSGVALKDGAGALGGTALAAAHCLGYRIVTCGCPSIGFAGGYTQKGGH